MGGHDVDHWFSRVETFVSKDIEVGSTVFFVRLFFFDG